MKKIFILILMLPFVWNVKAQETNDVARQLLQNTNIGINVYHTNDFRWRNFMIGTGYGQPISFIPKTYWNARINLNFNKYTIYGSGRYALTPYGNSTLKTTSISLPILAGYELFQTEGFGVNLYTGPVTEFVITSKLDGHNYDKINRFHAGWTVGSSFNFLYLFRFNVSYIYYPISLFNTGNLTRSAFQFSFGF